MHLDKTIKFLKAVGAKVPISQSRAGWVVASCPLGPWTHENGKSHTGAFGIKKEPGDAFCNCLAGETLVATWNGTKQIRELTGGCHRILTAGGTWVEAPFKSYGTQPIYRITLSLNGVEKHVLATAGHRWFVRNSGTRTKSPYGERTTLQLKKGHRLASVVPNAAVPDPSDVGKRHGLVFGDGSVQRGKYASIQLFGACRQLAYLFKAHNIVERDDRTSVYIGADGRYWKTLPSLDADPTYLSGFISGWVAADGHVDAGGTVHIASANPDHLAWLKDACLRIGLALNPMKTQSRQGYGEGPRVLHSATFVRSRLKADWFALPEQRARFKEGAFERLRWTVLAVEPTGTSEEVFCAEVPGTHSFALDNNLLTGNCFSCGWHGKMSDLVIEMGYRNKVTQHLTVKWGELLQMIEEEEAGVDLNLDSPDIEEKLFGERKKLHPFDEWWLGTFPSWREVGFAKAYLEERNVPAKVADFLDLRADPQQRRVCVPVRDFSGTLMGLHGRAVDKDAELRYRMYKFKNQKNTLIWLGEHWVDLSKPIVIVEGYFDLASVLRVYRNVVCPLFVNPSHDKLRRMADAMEWVTFLDSGKGGETGRVKISKFLSKDHVLDHLVPPDGIKDPGVMSVDQLVDVLADKLQLTAIIV